MLTHNYLNDNSSELTVEGNTLYDALVVPNPNVRLVLCGHNRGFGHGISSIDDNGDGVSDRTVNQIMINYQGYWRGGNGYLTLLTVNPQNREISLLTYSPMLDDYIYKDGSPEGEYFTFQY